jgi:hypothetical protein
MEQIIKLTGRIAEVMPLNSGVSQRTGNQWKSQEYLFEYFSWGGALYPNRIICRVFGEENIAKFNLKDKEENVTLTLNITASKSQDGSRWFNEIRITNVARQGAQQPVQAENNQHANNQPEAQNQAPQSEQNEGGKGDDLPF